MLSAGTIVGGGFRLIEDQPAAILVWGLLFLARFGGAIATAARE